MGTGQLCIHIKYAPRLQFFTIRTDHKPVNNVFIVLLLVGRPWSIYNICLIRSYKHKWLKAHSLCHPSYGSFRTGRQSLSAKTARNPQRVWNTRHDRKRAWRVVESDARFQCAQCTRSLSVFILVCHSPRIPFNAIVQTGRSLRILITVRLSILQGRIIVHIRLKQVNFPYKIHLFLHASLHCIFPFFLL